jgi:Na+/glutamate symporter
MSVTPQMRELFIAYGLTAAAMLIGLLLMRADRRAYFRWPVYSVMVMALGVVLWNLLRKQLLPDEWVFTRAGAMYYAALALYFVMGLGTGALLGRLTRRKTSGGSSGE